MDIDNQQAKTLWCLGWLSAILDGEGWISFNRQELASGNYRYIPVVGMNNTSLILVDKYDSVLKDFGVNCWRGKRNFLYKKDQYTTVVRGFMKVKKLLEIITPHLIEKKDRAELMLEYIKYRESFENPKRSFCGEKEESFFLQLKEMNQKGKPQRLNTKES